MIYNIFQKETNDMTRKEACKILGITQNAEETEIKKRYRQLVRRLHPDAQADVSRNSSHEIQQIILAYQVLKEEKFFSTENASPDGSSRKASVSWDAPLNVHAYREREILHSAEDSYGRPAGNFCIARGKYFWKTEEDFPLFLLSVYRCSKDLLDEIDVSLKRPAPAFLRQKIHPELCYLMAQQFIDGTALLKELAKEEPADSAGFGTFYLPAMLESWDPSLFPKPGELLFPARIHQHRLYLKDAAGKELGYLSFPDDRLYYVVIPLFEQKSVLVKIQTSQEKKKNTGAACRSLHLWIRLTEEIPVTMPESLNLQIEKLLGEYAKSSSF